MLLKFREFLFLGGIMKNLSILYYK